MIVQEFINDLLFTHSDSNFYIIQNETGQKYEDAWDTLPCKYTYSESEELIPKREEEDDVISGQETN